MYEVCAAMSTYGSGDLGRVQQQASTSRRGLPAASLLGSTGGLHAGMGQARGHLEANMAAALALQSPQEYKRWLATYASHLAGDFLVSNHTFMRQQVHQVEVPCLPACPLEQHTSSPPMQLAQSG